MPSTRALVKDKSGHEFYLQTDGKRFYPDFELHEERDYGDHLKMVRDFDVRSDDVIVFGYPKSGNHWLHEVMSMCLNQTTEYADLLFTENVLELVSEEQVATLNAATTPRLLSTHLNIDSLPAQVVEKRPKLVYLVRNIKDVCASMYDFCTVLKKYVTYKGKWEDYLDLQMSGKWVYGCWFEHILNSDNFKRDHPDVPFHVVLYENLKQNPVEEISALCQFLGKPDTLAPAIAERTSFQTMKKKYVAEKQGQWEKQACEGDGTLLKKGTFGRWKTYFTVAQSQWIDSVFKEKLGDRSIGAQIKPYL